MRPLVCFALAAVLATAEGCGRVGYRLLEAQEDASLVDADPNAPDADPNAPDADPSAPDAGPQSVSSPIFYIDAANTDGANTPGSQGCPGMGTSSWSDLASASVGSLLNFGLPPCAPRSGWKGDGTPSNPHRLLFENVASQGVSFGRIAHTPLFSVEAWVRWTGNGTITSTGTGGINVYPVVAKGTGENEITEIDENYFLAISPTADTLAADFEESVTHDNHPIIGTTTLVAGNWYHFALTYDQAGLLLYLNGAFEAGQTVSDPASVAVDSFLGVGANYLSTGLSDGGFFDGDIAVVRIFDRALSATEIFAECEAFAERFAGLSCGP